MKDRDTGRSKGGHGPLKMSGISRSFSTFHWSRKIFGGYLQANKLVSHHNFTVAFGPGGGTHIFFGTGTGDVPLNRVSFSGFRLRDRPIIFVKIGSMTGSIFVIFDSERSF